MKSPPKKVPVFEQLVTAGSFLLLPLWIMLPQPPCLSRHAELFPWNHDSNPPPSCFHQAFCHCDNSQSHGYSEGFSQHQRRHRVEGWPAAMIESYPSGARNQITPSICKSPWSWCYHSIRMVANTLTPIPPCGHLVYLLIHQQTLG